MFKQLSHWLWRSKPRWLYGVLTLVTAFSLWAITPQAVQARSWLELLIRGAQVLQLSNISDRQEVAIGQQINEQLGVQLRRRGTPLMTGNRTLNAYVNELGNTLVQGSERPNIPYTFQVVADRDVNAFATMGGFVYLNAGLLLLADNEAELASVVAHEIGHITARHAIRQMRSQAITQGLLSAAGLQQDQAVQIGVELALNRPNSREDELEADRLGLDMLRRANYEPTAMISFMQKLQRQGGQIPTFLSTHPATGDRIRLLQEALRQNPPTETEVRGVATAPYQATIRQLLR
ncbi:M48 family metalloprotease [Spirulina subsalsa FACHB-351]|uniref:M48 family metalloprotease n=1 Tax=Spirulina subsalsa FACHB-351 TaxID=234711 RepID=A0ABT3L4L7_9CYAN|nr:M48 family metallopeptidase [Spirulina subsalsa]MCW6036420.1 M48 family metalloprotease [Spirulina subsalsa FACHB-351]